MDEFKIHNIEQGHTVLEGKKYVLTHTQNLTKNICITNVHVSVS